MPRLMNQGGDSDSESELFGGEEKICRNCHESDNTEDLIAPCQCSGSIKWVHRACLDKWRSVSPNPASFSTCDNCKGQYRVIVNREQQCCRRTLFAALVARDIFAIIFLVNAVVLGFGFLADLVIPADRIVMVFQDPSSFMRNRIFRIYAFGGLITFFVLGIASIVYLIAKKCCCENEEEEETVANNYPYRDNCGDCYFIYCGPTHYHGSFCCPTSGASGIASGSEGAISTSVGSMQQASGSAVGAMSGTSSCGSGDCGNCNCNNGCGGGNHDCGDAGILLVVLLLIVIVVIVLIGLVFGVFLFTIVVAKIAHRHLHVLNLTQKTKIFHVANLDDPREVALSVTYSEATSDGTEVDEDVEPLLSESNNERLESFVSNKKGIVDYDDAV